jgi:replicative DNA helicase
VPTASVQTTFYYRRHMEIWAALLALTDRDEPVDPLTVVAELGRRGVAQEFEVCGGATAYVHSLPTMSGPAANVTAYADRVIELSALRRKRRAAHDLLEAIAKEDYQAVEETEQRLTAIPLPGARSVPDGLKAVTGRREAA